jgi:uncharacterized GH25 family protein
MKLQSHVLRAWILAFFVLGVLTLNACAAVDITMGIELDAAKINAGDTFDVKIYINNTDNVDLSSSDDIEVTITADGIPVHSDTVSVTIDQNESDTITISSGSFKDENGDNIWEASLMNYKCGTMDIKVTLGGGVATHSDTAELEIIGEKFVVDLTPAAPTAASNITVDVEDKADKDPINGATVRLTQLASTKWSIDDASRDQDTDEGVATFDPISKDSRFNDNIYRTYRLDVFKENYCIFTKSFSLQNKLRITEVPQKPYSGDEIRVKIVDAADKGVENAKLTVSGTSGVIGSYTSDSSGYVKFTLSNGGTYSLLASKSGFDNSDTASITAMNRASMDLNINPDKVAIGKEVTITATANGKAVEGATVTIEKPGGARDTLSTSSSGKVVYTPGAAGSYNVIVKKDGYETTTKSFSAANFFYITLPDAPKVHASITVAAKDQDGKPITDAAVSIQGTTVSGTTDATGQFSFTLDNAGDYTLSVKKTGFTDYSQKITAYGTLKAAVVPQTLDLDESVTISVSDDGGASIEASIGIIRPDGTKENTLKSTYTFTPQIAGEYRINVTRTSYLPATVSFEVNPYPLQLEVWMSGKDLTIKATKEGVPVESINLSVLTPAGNSIAVETNKDGIAKLDIKGLNETGTFTVSSLDRNYEKKSVTKSITSLGGDFLPLLLVGVVMLILLVFVVFIVFYISHKKSRSSTWSSKPKKQRGGGVGLGEI